MSVIINRKTLLRSASGWLLTGELVHMCPHVDNLPIDESCAEFLACACVVRPAEPLAFGRLLQRCRVQRKVGGATLASHLGITPGRLDHVEKGRKVPPLSLELTVKACEFLRAYPHGLLLARARMLGVFEIPLVEKRADIVWVTRLACSGLRA